MSAMFNQSAKVSSDLSHLSQVMQVSVEEIERIYAVEVRRLAAEARIQTFVGVLAMSHTRDFLHRIKKLPSSS